ncbi:hypoxanthine phosphoribosyltransferase [Spiroplasma turonicum]|uniref:Hypoxanthine phosphoribosyltransferase n=1 Tax=Spiroplasma turonicum TaxID=216946 RepID=A0A0K1P7K5_9MOLU|nr:hypoxanthine phosphoribosyltransferase [Spiroplasma turonicum]AKU80169.1 hypoxanthine-guanine phosphoribosyltransferase [Spiroplasma turonicum]ALX71169.1 hypoxanthine-guanine phosphoribosyltransferase [Spiroplasma turonicum]
MTNHPLVKEVLVDRNKIDSKIKELAHNISNYYKSIQYKNNTVITVGLLKGCVPFMAGLLKDLEFNCITEYMIVSSYEGNTTNIQKPKIINDIKINVEGAHVLLIEDIIDSGITLSFIKEHILGLGAKEVKVVTLASKPNKIIVDLKPDWNGFEFGDEFLIGFGLDYQERLRNLPFIATCNVEKLTDWEW